jgi:hypothetical protein
MTKPMLFIDPGDVHVGLAVFTEALDGWLCTEAFEMSPDNAELFLKEVVQRGEFSVIGYERFRLFGHLALAQTGSEFRASQMIGVIKFLFRTETPSCQLVVQDPNCQPIAAAVAERRGIPLQSVTRKRGGHAKSAELHGIYYLSRGNQPLSVVKGKI